MVTFKSQRLQGPIARVTFKVYSFGVPTFLSYTMRPRHNEYPAFRIRARRNRTKEEVEEVEEIEEKKKQRGKQRDHGGQRGGQRDEQQPQ